MQKRRLAVAALAALGFAVAGVASASPVTMTFDEFSVDTTPPPKGNGNVNNGQYVANYYNGGCSASFNGFGTTCGGPDYGVVWSGNAVARAGLQAGDDMPSSPNSLMLSNAQGQIGNPQSATMSVANGFMSEGFSFYYSASNKTASVSFYSGLNGDGDLLYSTGLLSSTPTACLPHTGLFACWNLVDQINFSGVAHSAVFAGGTNNVAFDSVSFNTMTPQPPVGVPEPGALGMFGLGALVVGAGAVFARRRREAEAD